MPVTRQQFIDELRGYIGTKFGHQGRSKNAMDCGGLALVGGRKLGLTTLEFLGYATFPTEGKFDELLADHNDYIGEYRFPFTFTGDELRPADLLSYDFGNGEGTKHLAVVTGWDGRHYRVIDALNNYGVSEHPLRTPLITSKTILKGWAIRGLTD